ncbi:MULTISPECIES: restriction endonuclease subunit S [unclassified Rhizobium]|uniref:restriction endonuclease subunit S n=1 Tax=unclassified Rhizobium TaxID=2613769 RepID=UPI0006F40B62|nr:MULTISPECIES: restriction endonuclease subunit S [unclassified Rhizobium]KQV35769.1 restriction endonuclease subunit S [Rhizobium sp. Root1212]KRD25876.1 restriction endonuclease subunit S [Rhizobium sp. Root268]
MNAERLLQHYEKIADAPDAIARLRRFILDLAVRGKLVPQDFEDEPASELLKRIAEEKARLLKAGEIRTPKPHSAVVDAPFSIPSNWSWSQIAEVGIVSPRNDAPDTLEKSFVPMPLIAAEYGVANRHEVRPWGEIKKGYTHFAEGDVGLAKITPCFENGKSTVFRNLTGGIGSGTTELHVVRPLLVVADYILLFWKSPHFIETGIPKMTGTAGQKRVPTDYFANSPFPLPPLAEQHRIVAKVDELMALCDALEAARMERETKRDRLASASLARLNTPDPETFREDARFALDALPALTARPDQIKQMRQTILNLAVRGKLVPQDPADEPAEELLKRLMAAQSAACRDESLRARPPVKKLGRSDLWFDVPDEWVLSSFDDLFVIVSGVTKGQKVSPSEAADAPYLRVANVQRGHLDLTVIKTISVRRSDIERYALREGDVLMTEGGDWDKLGRAAIWRDEIPNCIHQNHIFRVRPPSADVSPAWIITYVNSHLGRAFFENASKQTTNLASINMTQLRACPFPLPPLAEQHRIVAKVDELMALCDQLESSLTHADETRKKLLDALLAEALAPVDAEVLQEAAE